MATKNNEKWLILKVYGLEFMDNESRWLANYDALRAQVLETGHFPNRAKIESRGLLNWYKYNTKLIKQGKLSPEREEMIHELEKMRSGEHTGGRRKQSDTPSNELLLDL